MEDHQKKNSYNVWEDYFGLSDIAFREESQECSFHSCPQDFFLSREDMCTEDQQEISITYPGVENLQRTVEMLAGMEISSPEEQQRGQHSLEAGEATIIPMLAEIEISTFEGQQRGHHSLEAAARGEARIFPALTEMLSTFGGHQRDQHSSETAAKEEAIVIPEEHEFQSQQTICQEQVLPATRIFCVFCKKNGETQEFYTAHKLKDSKGRIHCPVLRKYVCPICNATGDMAHTVGHCPYTDSSRSGVSVRSRRMASGRPNIFK